MTTEEFFADLVNVCERFEWKLVPDTRTRRPERRSASRLHLRAELGIGASRVILDPVGAVCYARTGKLYQAAAWEDAGEDLGMAPSDAAKVYAASNDRTWTGPKGKREPLPDMITMRLRLLESVGLAVPSH